MRLEAGYDSVPKFLQLVTEQMDDLEDIYKNLHHQFLNTQNPESLLPFMLVYSITLTLYGNLVQDLQGELMNKNWTSTMENYKKLLKLI